ncbi:hypothetical protein GGR93_001419 [Sulfitobacter noctilucicola]|uniref:Uncharacterized protein n=2 Tax=Sulfitobacter noctilucicola TaxID=1342301 RepID=A0A7W6M8Y9_9RHOB|nr:hypothetical protein [Sulfitobacter noctilucicola]
MRTLGTICAIWLLFVTTAQASCERLVNVIGLSGHGFASGKMADNATLSEIETLISGLDNDVVLHLLRQSGQAHTFGFLRHHLTVLKFIALQAEANAEPPKNFNSDMVRAAGIVALACQGNAQGHGDHEAKGFRQSYTESAEQNLGLRQTGWKTSQEHLRLAHQRQLKQLIALMTGFLVLLALAIVVHFALMVTSVIFRGRRICDVPVRIDILGQEIACRIKGIGKRGCHIIPDDTGGMQGLRVLSQGGYFNIVLDDLVLNARISETYDDGIRARFTLALTRNSLRQIMLESELPVRYDLEHVRLANMWHQYMDLGTVLNRRSSP